MRKSRPLAWISSSIKRGDVRFNHRSAREHVSDPLSLSRPSFPSRLASPFPHFLSLFLPRPHVRQRASVIGCRDPRGGGRGCSDHGNGRRSAAPGGRLSTQGLCGCSGSRRGQAGCRSPAGAWLQPENLRRWPRRQDLPDAGWGSAERNGGWARAAGRVGSRRARLSAQGGCGGGGGGGGDGRLRGRELRAVLVSDNALEAGARWRSASAL